jgi:hypothetical protein
VLAYPTSNLVMIPSIHRRPRMSRAWDPGSGFHVALICHLIPGWVLRGKSRVGGFQKTAGSFCMRLLNDV